MENFSEEIHRRGRAKRNKEINIRAQICFNNKKVKFLEMSEHKNCRIYIRVSTEEQVRDGVSIEQQQQDIKRYCDFNQITITKTYIDDGYSGADIERPQFNLLLSEVRPKELIIVWDLSRFSRKTWHAIKTAEELFEKKIYLVSLKDKIDLSTAMGKCVFAMTCAFFALERDKVRERTSAALQHLSREGKLRSRAPFGWKYMGRDKDMVAIPEQQTVIQYIVHWYRTESLGISSIAARLNAQGLNKTLCLNKKPEDQNKEFVFHPETVKRILIDQGVITSTKKKRPPINQRIISHHRSDSASENIISVPSQGPILEIVY